MLARAGLQQVVERMCCCNGARELLQDFQQTSMNRVTLLMLLELPLPVSQNT
uniref:Uncharacterized protein n=1 Tax=Peronospora matthiolae TaxID=2874970 RepID=A0AAV1UIW9_9STRA